MEQVQDPEPLAALTDEDRAWLDRMADVLPPGVVVAGSSRWVLFSPDLALIYRTWR